MPDEDKTPKKEESGRSRDKNYTDLECLELIRAIKKYAHIIECRKSNTVGKYKYKNDDRNAAWESVCHEFNMRTSQNRTVAGLKMKWKNDKSNIRDYIQYLKTSQSRSGRAPEEIPKPRFMNLIADIIGADCPALGPVPDVDELCMETSANSINTDGHANTFKQEPQIDHPDLTFEEIMVNGNSDPFNYTVEDTSSIDSFHESAPHPNKDFQPPSAKRPRQSIQGPSSFQSNGVPTTMTNNSDILQLQIQLLKRQIEVQELMATELRVKIQRAQQLMQMEAAESQLRCREIEKRLES